MAEAQDISLKGPSSATTASSSKAPLIFITVAVVLLAFFFFKRHAGTGSTASGQPAPAHPSWGPAVILQIQDQFKVPDEIEGIRADSQGNVFVLTHSSLTRYSKGRLEKVLDLKISGQYMNLGFDGTSLFVTNAGDGEIRRIPKDLSGLQKIKVKGASNLLAICANSNGHVYAGDVTQHLIFSLDGFGKDKGTIGGSAAQDGGLDCPVDVAQDDSGDLYVSDHVTGRIIHFGPKGSMVAAWPAPWNSHQGGFERLCILKNTIYISGFNDQRIFIQDLQGNNVAQSRELSNGAKLEHPQMVGPGADGFLYVKDGETVFKLKPWSPSPEAKSEAAPGKAASSK